MNVELIVKFPSAITRERESCVHVSPNLLLLLLLLLSVSDRLQRKKKSIQFDHMHICLYRDMVYQIFILAQC